MGLCVVAVLLRIGSQWWSWALQLRLWLGMSLHTAISLTLLHAGLWAWNRWPQHRTGRLVGWCTVALSGAGALVVVARQFVVVPIEFEQWLVRLLTPAADKPGHMSLHTGLTFLAAAGSLACLLVAGGRVGWWRRAAG